MKKFYSLATILSGVVVCTLTARAHPYASGITNTQDGNIHWVLNEPASDVQVVYQPNAANWSGTPVTNDLGAIAASGSNIFSLTYQTVTYTNFSIIVSNTGKSKFSQISSDTNPDDAFFGARGMAVNKNPNTWNFGKIYVVNASPGNPGVAGNARTTTSRGVYIMDAAQNDLYARGTAAANAGITFSTSTTYGPYRVAVGPDDVVYIADGTTAGVSGGIYMTDPAMTGYTNIFTSGSIPNAGLTLTTGSTTGIATGGTGYTANEILTVVGGTLAPGGVAATLKVSPTVNAGGIVTNAVIQPGGGPYTVLPTLPLSVTATSGTGATFGNTTAADAYNFFSSAGAEPTTNTSTFGTNYGVFVGTPNVTGSYAAGTLTISANGWFLGLKSTVTGGQVLTSSMFDTAANSYNNLYTYTIPAGSIPYTLTPSVIQDPVGIGSVNEVSQDGEVAPDGKIYMERYFTGNNTTNFVVMNSAGTAVIWDSWTQSTNFFPQSVNTTLAPAISAGGTGYTVGATLEVVGGTLAPGGVVATLKVATTNGATGAILTATAVSGGGPYTVMPPDPFSVTSTNASGVNTNGTGATFIRAGSFGSDHINNVYSVQVSPDDKFVALNYSASDQFMLMSLTNGIPDISTLTTNLTVGAAGGTTGRQTAWDAADNIYCTSGGSDTLRVFSPGFSSVATTYNDNTGTNGTFNIELGSQIGSGIPDMTILESPSAGWGGGSIVASQTMNYSAAGKTNLIGGVISLDDNSGLTYQWYHNGSATSDGAVYLGSTTYNLSITGITGANAGTYNYVATDASGSVTSSNFIMNVVDPLISTQPASKVNQCGSATASTFSVTASGSGTLTYQWYQGATPLTSAGTVTGATASTLTLATPSESEVGSYSVVVTGSAGSATSSVVTLTLSNNIAPVITLNSTAIVTNQCGTTYTEPGASASQLCEGSLSVTTLGSVNFGTVGTYSITYSATDPTETNATKQTTTATREVKVLDTAAPVISLNVSSPETLQCPASYTEAGATENDACAGTGLSITTTGSVGSSVGTYVVSYSAKDPSGNTGTAALTVIVQDTAAPVVTLTGALLVTNECGSAYVDPGATESDTCAGNSLSITTSSIANTPTGTYTITYTATDPSGNSGTAKRTVVVQDTTAPVITQISPGSATVECSTGSYTEVGATESDACGGNSLSITTLGSVNVSTVGTYTISYITTDPSANSTTNTRLVFVSDTTAPVVTLGGTSMITNECSTAFVDPGATENDACAGAGLSVTTIGSVNAGAVGTYLLTYAATDPSGNTGSNVLTVIVQDTTAPVVTVNPGPGYIECSTSYTEAGATESDDCAGGGLSVTTLGSVNVGALGTYIITYVATDPSGNSDTNTRVVTVVDTTPPVITVLGYSPTNVFQHTTFVDAGATANDTCAGSVSVTTTGSVNTTLVGTYSLTYSAVDPSDNPATSQTREVIVVSDIPPVVTVPAANVITNYGATAVLTATVTGPDLTYYWRFATNSHPVKLSDGGDISGSSTASLTIANLTHLDVGSYSLVITNPAASVTSAVATVKVVQPVIVTNPVAGATNNTGTDDTVFTVAAIGDGTLHYQWYSTKGSGTPTLLAGKTAASLTLNLTATNQQLGYYAIVNNTYGKATSTVAQLTVYGVPTITTQPAKLQTPVAGTNVSFTVKAAGTAPLSYQWNFDGAPIDGATSTIYSLINAQAANNGSYSCTVSNISGVLTTTTNTHGILALIPDTNKPTVSVTGPTVLILTNGIAYGGGLIAPTFAMAGKAKDLGLVTNIVIQRIFPTVDDPINAATNELAPGAVTYSNILTLADGTNIYNVWAVNSGGVSSKTNVVKLFFLNDSLLTIVTTNGSGVGITTNVTAASKVYGTAQSGQYIALTRNFTVKAIPGPNSIFTNWTDTNGNVLTTNVNYTFTMTPNLTLNANFLTNPIVAAGVAGSYNGLFYNDTTIVQESSGFIGTCVVKTNRTYSGTLKQGGFSYTLAGTFDLSGNSTATIVRTSHGESNLTVSLNLDWSGANNGITGTVTDLFDGWSASLQANKATNVSGVTAQKYTLVIPPGAGAPDTTPGGYGYASVVNSASGVATFGGTLADGTTFSPSEPLAADGSVPLYATPYGNSGLLIGWLDITETAISGTVTWIKPTTNKPATYPNGFTNTVDVSGSVYAPLTPAITLASGTLTITDADITGIPLTYNVAVSNNNKIVSIAGGATNKLSGSITPGTGIFTVTYQPTGSSVAHEKTATGIVTQSSNSGVGTAIGTNTVGSVSFGP